ncbi:hypothetical protein [Mucilaginibacter sp. FT3.2]|uniref:hypothetical protein n=1 Tax=Mucilaginibacter sp. FT3.2 TaxID=2723090 RepID=UPI00160A5C33|nr:hypothetical protein [Mucilaginibacter sp. FT3.2]MBB6235254.1 hypothetical protein [Mucilaginibacter sp. FT3.2]
MPVKKATGKAMPVNYSNIFIINQSPIIMKTPYVILITGIIALSICLAFTIGNSSNRTNIKITETPWLFKLEASYNPAESKNVEDYLNQSLKPLRVFTGTGDVDRQITLADSTTFYIRASAGRLLLKAYKCNNTAASLQRVKNICGQLSKNVIKP